MKLGQVATISAGYPFRGKITEKAETNIVAVQMRDVAETYSINWSTCTETVPTGKREPDWLREGDILVAGRGNRYYAVMVRDIPNNIAALAAPQFYVIRVSVNHLLPEFLVWQLNQVPCQNYLEKNSEGTSSKSIRASVLIDVTITVPPLDKQRTVLELNRVVENERKAAESLIVNGEQLLASIAKGLLNNA